MSSFTYTLRAEGPVGASKCEFEDGLEHTCVQPWCGERLTMKGEICPRCKANPFIFDERVLTKEQLSYRRAVLRGKEELSH